MFFILSTGRSGTASIAKTLSALSGCSALHEPEPQLILEASAYRYGTAAADHIKDILRETRHPTLGGSVYCESNQNLSLIVPLLAEVFPDARFVWQVRNGLDAVASMYQKQWYSGHSENHDRYEECSPLEKAWIDGRIRADRCGEMSVADWAGLDRFEKCCWYWGYVNRIIGNDLEQYAADRYTTLKLETLAEELERLVNWMGFRPARLPPVQRSNVARRIPFHWSEWNAQQMKSFMRWCSDSMDRFYPDWRAVTGANSTLFVLPAIKGLNQRVADETRKRQRLEGQLRQVRNELNSMKSSLVWRIASPFCRCTAFGHDHAPILAPLERISVITVCLNAQDTIEATLQSIHEQTYPDIEHIVIDGGSTDGTLDIIERYRERIDYFVSEPDSGIYNAMNKGVRAAGGDILFFLNADDRFCDAAVAADVATLFAQQPDLQLVYGDVVLDCADGPRRQVQMPSLTRRRLAGGNVCHQAIFTRREAFLGTGGFDEQYRIVSDWDKLMKLVNGGVRARHMSRDIALIGVSGQTYSTDWEREKELAMSLYFKPWQIFWWRTVLRDMRHALLDFAPVYYSVLPLRLLFDSKFRNAWRARRAARPAAQEYEK